MGETQEVQYLQDLDAVFVRHLVIDDLDIVGTRAVHGEPRIAIMGAIHDVSRLVQCPFDKASLSGIFRREGYPHSCRLRTSRSSISKSCPNFSCLARKWWRLCRPGRTWMGIRSTMSKPYPVKSLSL